MNDFQKKIKAFIQKYEINFENWIPLPFRVNFDQHGFLFFYQVENKNKIMPKFRHPILESEKDFSDSIRIMEKEFSAQGYTRYSCVRVIDLPTELLEINPDGEIYALLKHIKIQDYPESGSCQQMTLECVLSEESILIYNAIPLK